MRLNNYKTKQKDLVLNSIISMNRKFTINEIYEKLEGKVGLTTIYRLVDKLIFEGKIKKYIEKDNTAYYQYFEECDLDNHFYLKCEECGDIIHVDCDCIKDLSKHIDKKHKFVISKQNIVINGICDKCKNK